MAKKTLDLEKIEVDHLPGLAGLIEKQNQVLKDYPFVKIVDTPTYELAKKNRTALITARTTIEKEESTIASNLAKFRKLVGLKTAELIKITQPAEILQQSEVKRFEDEKEAEKQAKIKAENDRIDALKEKLTKRYDEIHAKISSVTFEKLEEVEVYLTEITQEEPGEFEEFLDRFEEDNLSLYNQFQTIQKTVKEAEETRLEKIRLKAASDKLAADQKILDDAAEVLAAGQRKLAADQKKLADKKAADLKAIADKKAADLKAIADKKAADQKKIDDEKEAAAEKKRTAALRPDKEKLISFIESLNFEKEMPILNDSKLAENLTLFVKNIDKLKEDFVSSVNNYN